MIRTSIVSSVPLTKIFSHRHFQHENLPPSLLLLHARKRVSGPTRLSFQTAELRGVSLVFGILLLLSD
jgi:hypothetical protein